MFFLKYFERKRNEKQNRELAVKKMQSAETVFSHCLNYSTTSPEAFESMRSRFNEAASWLLDEQILRAAFPKNDKFRNSRGEFAIPRLSAAGDNALSALAITAKDASMDAIRIEATKRLHEIHKIGKKIWREHTYNAITPEFSKTIRKNVDSDNSDLRDVATYAFDYLADKGPSFLVQNLDENFTSWVLEKTGHDNERIRRAAVKCLINSCPIGDKVIMDKFRYNATQAAPIYPDNIEAYQKLQDKIADKCQTALTLS